MVKLVTIFLCLSISSFALKAETEAQKKLENCIAESDLTTASMTNCANNASEDWDKELNQVYQELMNKLNPKAKEELRLSQLKWLKHRDKELEFIDAMYYDERFQGTMYSNMRAADRFSVVKERVLVLRGYLNLFN